MGDAEGTAAHELASAMLSFNWPSASSFLGQFIDIDASDTQNIISLKGPANFVSAADMEPCPADDPAKCPTYPAKRPVVHALEVPKGELGARGVGPGSTIRA